MSKKLRLLHIKTAKAKAKNSNKPEFMAFATIKLPSKENRAIDNYRINFYDKVVKKR
jgi:hypothetical protein